MTSIRFLLVFSLSTLFVCSAQQSKPYVAHYLNQFPGPQVYRDTKSGTVFYVESDGRHVAAISKDGKLLWNKDPFKDGRLPLYRTKTPQIVYIGAAYDSVQISKRQRAEFIAISFNSSQFGLLRISDGEFRFLGQD
jgi:hypothetical protein